VLSSTQRLIPVAPSLLAGVSLNPFSQPGCSCHHPEDKVLGLDSLILYDIEVSAGVRILAERMRLHDRTHRSAYDLIADPRVAEEVGFIAIDIPVSAGANDQHSDEGE
jgi:hypothetical protein